MPANDPPAFEGHDSGEGQGESYGDPARDAFAQEDGRQRDDEDRLQTLIHAEILSALLASGSRDDARMAFHAVLELICERKSNAQIARALFISAKTVGHHVSAVLAKLGVENREAAAEMNRNLTA